MKVCQQIRKFLVPNQKTKKNKNNDELKNNKYFFIPFFSAIQNNFNNFKMKLFCI